MNGKTTLLMALSICGGIALFFFLQNVVLDQGVPVEEEQVAEPTVVERGGRAATRAFYAAPPVIPHPLDSQEVRDCLRCHRQVTRLEGGRVAMQTPHAEMSSCLQCHVPQLPSVPGGSRPVASTWVGLEEPQRGQRWFWTSPPTVPHRRFMRENCLSCHGPKNPDTRLRTTHPERTQCLQCHVPSRRDELWTP